MRSIFIKMMMPLILIASVNAEEENQILTALNEAKLKGKELYSYSIEVEPKKLKDFELPKRVSKAAKKLQCKGHKYKYYQVSHSDGSSAIYGISQPKKEGVVIGRHITIPTTDTPSADSVVSSTKSCLEIHGAPDYENILFTTHLLSFTPNLFHVYQSINYDTTIYVVTEVARWKVQKGEIGILK